jgi:hypothetical protein
MPEARLKDHRMSASTSPALPSRKELVPFVAGFVLGLGIMALFLMLAMAMNLTLLVNHAAIPHQ